MAYAAPAHPSSSNLVMRLIDRIFTALVVSAQNDARLRRIEALRAKSDSDLAKMGLKREDIARRVFGDLFYI